jgi:inorganic pyrophosphatase
MQPLQLVAEGQEGTIDYRLRFKDASGRDISPWHDVPLSAGKSGIFNAVIEIPKMAKAKMEVATKESMNAIAQDVKKGKLRDYHGPIYWNYGMMPQTWESPYEENPEVKCRGDNDPLDVVEIGSKSLALGTVEPIKPLGVLAMIDDGELDWKVIAISANDPLSAELEDIADVEKHCPGMISGIREWFRWYKTPDGKPLNQFGFNEEALDRNKALAIINETHEAWRQLVTGRVSKDKLWVPSKKLPNSYHINAFDYFHKNSQQLHAVSVAGTSGSQKQPRGWQTQTRSKL